MRNMRLCNNFQTNLEWCMPFILIPIDSWGRLNAWLNSWMLHVSCAFHLQTETTSLDMDDCDDKVIQNTDTQSNVSMTNPSDTHHMSRCDKWNQSGMSFIVILSPKYSGLWVDSVCQVSPALDDKYNIIKAFTLVNNIFTIKFPGWSMNFDAYQ